MPWQAACLMRRIREDDRGHVAIMYGLLALPLFGITGLSVDYGMALRAKSALQDHVDAAAVAGARLPATANANRTNAAKAMLSSTLNQSPYSAATSTIAASNAEVTVQAVFSQPTSMLNLFGVKNIKVKVSSSARSQIENGGVVCMLALNETTSDGLHMQGITKASSKNCWTWVNSSSASSINATGAASGIAQGFCTVGGVVGGEHFAPTPYTGCEAVEDPFASRFAWSYPYGDWCDYSDVSVKSGTYTLSPGVYCGGIELRPQADVTFQPGIYVLRNGPLLVQAGSSAKGNGVAFFFRGSDTTVEVRGGANVDLTAPSSGFAAGFLFVDRTFSWETGTINAIIQGGGNLKMEGILYAPRWKMLISGNSQINQNSKFFAMIANQFSLEGNGKLFINSDAAGAGLPDLMPRIKSGPVITH